MKRLVSFLILIIVFFRCINLPAQCIYDVYYLTDSSMHCNFVGVMNLENPECFDPLASPAWDCTWEISDPAEDTLMATYKGLVFYHEFEQFGGYDFTLKVDKDADPNTPPDIVERSTYTTCELCGPSGISVEYLDCPLETGCVMQVNAFVKALNMVGIDTFAVITVTYHPTPQEMLNGDSLHYYIFPYTDVDFLPDSGLIRVSEKINLPTQRGCYKAAIEFRYFEGAGAHRMKGMPGCERFTLEDDKYFRCLACTDDHCEFNQAASDSTNAKGACGLFYCPPVGLRQNASAPPSEPKSNASLVNISPNPAGDRLFVRFAEEPSPATSLHLLNAFGQPVLEQHIGNVLFHEWSVFTLPPGVYHLLVKENGKPLHSERVSIFR